MRPPKPFFVRLPNPYTQLFLGVVGQLVMLAFALPVGVQQVLNLVLTVWLASAAASIAGLRRVFWVALALGWTPALLDLAVPGATSPVALQAFKEVLWVAFPAYLGVRLAVPLFAAGEVSHRELMGAVTVYLLAGLAFSDVYELINLFQPGALTFAATAGGSDPAFTDYLYFSFVTLATLGYGDVSPVSPAARTAAVTEALLGLLYMTILIGRMVGLHIAHSMAGRQGYRATQDEDVP